MMKVIKTKKAPAALGPYEAGIKVGNFIFTSGQIPVDPKTNELVTGPIELQARQSLENIKGILEEEGYSLNDVVKTTVFLADINDFAAVNKVYGEYFSEHKPARSCLQVGRIPKNAGLEIEVIAYRE
ncbi:MAG: RidA family protein [Mycoplasma sp.]|nr:RidA family protein [Mycoplasma sp.]